MNKTSKLYLAILIASCNTAVFSIVCQGNHSGLALLKDKSRHYLLPADSGVVNVKEFGARGDGVTDDTIAIRAAVRAAIEKEGGSRYAFPPFVFFPEGTYLVSGPIESKVEEHGWSGGWRSGMLLLGEKRDTTIIRLKDNAEGYGDANNPKYVIATGSESDKTTKAGDKPLSGGGNRAFRHSIINLTIDIGSGNPGAVGIDYVANNRGTIEAVTIRSSDKDRAGHTGLKLTRHWPGPCLYKDILIEGFDIAIQAEHFEYGNTFEDITLRHQRKSGLVNKQNMLAIHGFFSENKVPAIRLTDSNGLVVVVNGRFFGGSLEQSAVIGNGALYMRDVLVEGYKMAVDAGGRKEAENISTVDGKAEIKFYASAKFAMGGAEQEPMRLQIKPTPLFWTTDHSQWTCPQNFLPDHGEKPEDWTEAIQAAMYSGKPVIYLPNGSYKVSRTIIVPSSVRLLIGFQSSITPGKDKKEKVTPLLRFTGKGGQGTTVEHLWIDGHVEHDADRAIAFRHCDLHGRYTNTENGKGDFFIEDTIGPKPFLVMYPQNVWARQLNIEFGNDPLIENYGGTLWLLGYKTEGEMICLKQSAGKTEMLGALIYPLRKVQGGTPAFYFTGGEAALSYAMSGPKYHNQVRIQASNGVETLTGWWRSVALVALKAGEGASIIEKTDFGNDIHGAFPFWAAEPNSEQSNAFTDKWGNKWSVVAIGGSDNIEQPEKWTSLIWNGANLRWEGAKMDDQAPSFDQNRNLRGRPSNGRLAGIVFQPSRDGNYRMSGSAFIDTWGPDGPAEIVVLIVGKDNTARAIFRQEFPDHSDIEWDKIEVLQNIQLNSDERLVITFVPTKGQTGTLNLKDNKNPSRIIKLESK